MEQTPNDDAWLKSLDPNSLRVGDGSDGLPLWIAVDPIGQKVYKVYASGLAEGFGDGRLLIFNGLKAGPGWRTAKAEQLTHGRHISLMGEEGGAFFEAGAAPTLLANREKPPQ